MLTANHDFGPARRMTMTGPEYEVPSDVAEGDRGWMLRIREARWTSEEARDQVLAPIALAYRNTKGLERDAWADRLIVPTFQWLVPLALRACGNESNDGPVSLREQLFACAVACEREANNEVAAEAHKLVGEALKHTQAYSATAWSYDVIMHVSSVFRDMHHKHRHVTLPFSCASAAAYASEVVTAGKASSGEAEAMVILVKATDIALDAYRAEGRQAGN